MLEHRLEEDADQANQPEDTPMLRSLIAALRRTIYCRFGLNGTI